MASTPAWAKKGLNCPLTQWAFAQPWWVWGLGVSACRHGRSGCVGLGVGVSSCHASMGDLAVRWSWVWAVKFGAKMVMVMLASSAIHHFHPLLAYIRRYLTYSASRDLPGVPGADQCLPARRTASRVRSEFPALDAFDSLSFTEQGETEAPKVCGDAVRGAVREWGSCCGSIQFCPEVVCSCAKRTGTRSVL
jgi:hypothetical protein